MGCISFGDPGGVPYILAVRDTIDSVDAGVYDDDDDDFGQGENYVFDEVAGEWTKKRRQLSARSRKREVIYREREQAMKRIENALVKSEELLLTDLDDEAEVGRAMRQQVLNLLEVQTEKMVGREEEMAELGQWFRIQADSAKSFISNPKEDEAAVDIDEFNVSIADNIIHRMTMLREKVTDISSSLMANALAMNNSEQWEMRLMGERRVFDEEMQRIVRPPPPNLALSHGVLFTNQCIRTAIQLPLSNGHNIQALPTKPKFMANMP